MTTAEKKRHQRNWVKAQKEIQKRMAPSEVKVHEVKAHPEYFQSVVTGVKTFELRLNDRDYQIGDQMLLQEYDPKHGIYCGKECLVDITGMIRADDTGVAAQGLKPGWCVMSIKLNYGTRWKVGLAGRKG